MSPRAGEAFAAITPLPVPRDELAEATIILFGGTFDPVHRGHLELGEEARRWVAGQSAPSSTTWLLFVPAMQSPHKGSGPAAPPADRLEMLRLATAAANSTGVWSDEIDRARAGESSFTIDTVRRARQWLDESGARSTRLRLLIGADQAASFHQWRQPREIMRLAPPIVMLREPHESIASLNSAMRAAACWSTDELDQWTAGMAPLRLVPVSATSLREAFTHRRWEAVGRDVPAVVIDYIRRHRLYAPGEPG